MLLIWVRRLILVGGYLVPSLKVVPPHQTHQEFPQRMVQKGRGGSLHGKGHVSSPRHVQLLLRQILTKCKDMRHNRDPHMSRPRVGTSPWTTELKKGHLLVSGHFETYPLALRLLITLRNEAHEPFLGSDN